MLKSSHLKRFNQQGRAFKASPKLLDVKHSELTLKQAADLVGVSKATLWRAVQRQEIKASQDEKGYYRLERETVMNWSETFHGGAQVLSQTAPDEACETVQGEPIGAFHLVSADLHRVALETTRQALETARRAEERAEKAERLQLALQEQLAQHHNVLGERAESLLDAETRAQKAEQLAVENAQRLAEFNTERDQLQQELKATRQRVNWLEHRIPRWIRRCFGDQAG